MDRVILFEEAQKILCRAVCAWVGIPLAKDEVRQRARQLAARVDAFGAPAPGTGADDKPGRTRKNG